MSKSLEQLDKDIEELQKQRKELLEKDRDEKLKEVKSIISTYGFTDFDLGFKKKSIKHRVKYINPENIAETWTGVGRKPSWVITHLDMGGKLEDVAAVKPIKV